MKDSIGKSRDAKRRVADRHYSRRVFVKEGGTAIALGMLAGAFGATVPRGVSAQTGAKGSDVLTILYPVGEGITFDLAYYRDNHMKAIKDLYGETIERIELRRVIAAQPPPGAPRAAPPIFSAVVNIWINDLGAFVATNEKHGETLADDVRNFTNSTPSIQFDKFQGEMGAARSVPRIGERCLMMLYPNGDGVRWDAEEYRTNHMPLIMELYGEKAIRRFEVHKGDAGMTAGSKPRFIGVVKIYVASQTEMQAAGEKHGARLRRESSTFSSVNPIVFPSIIQAIG